MKKKEFKKVPKKTKEKDIHICSKCLEDIKPDSLHWVTVIDSLNISFQTLICNDCLEHKEKYIDRYKSFEISTPLYKKREYKKRIKK